MSDDGVLGLIYLVEDDDQLAELTADYLRSQGYDVEREARGDLVMDNIPKIMPDLVVLDLMLPGKNGLDICRELRAVSDIPIIILTARTDDIDQIIGLEVGADDYVCKPVKPRLLSAKINALIRRSQLNQVTPKADANCLNFGQLIVDVNKQNVQLEGEQIQLTTNEFSLLSIIAQNANSIVSRSELTQALRGFDYDGLDRTVDMLISRLRKKLKDDTEKPYKIKTVWKKGYLFVSDAW
ncbi:response regulator [Alteromonadaceae bacterium M269]|nr:response regulator [Alteromonadaceae bacterium M269]